MDRRGFRAQRGELLGVVVGDLAGVDPTDAVGDLLGPGERRLHRVLLIQKHAHEQCERVGLQQRIGRGILN